MTHDALFSEFVKLESDVRQWLEGRGDIFLAAAAEIELETDGAARRVRLLISVPYDAADDDGEYDDFDALANEILDRCLDGAAEDDEEAAA